MATLCLHKRSCMCSRLRVGRAPNVINIRKFYPIRIVHCLCHFSFVQVHIFSFFGTFHVQPFVRVLHRFVCVRVCARAHVCGFVRVLFLVCACVSASPVRVRPNRFTRLAFSPSACASTSFTDRMSSGRKMKWTCTEPSFFSASLLTLWCEG